MKSPRFSRAQLDALIEEATIDCYNDEEQAMGLFTMIEENLVVPFDAMILGVPVRVERIDINDAGEIVAICKRGGQRQAIPLVDLPLPSPPPAGFEWDRGVSPLGSRAMRTSHSQFHLGTFANSS